MRCKAAAGLPRPRQAIGRRSSSSLAVQNASRPVDARDAYVRAQAIDPDYPYLRNNLAATYLECGHPNLAVEVLEGLVGEGRADALCFINLGIVHRKTFDLGRSVEMF